MAADVFSYLEVDHQHELITSMSEKDAAGIINNLMADDATDLLEEMPANIVKKILANANRISGEILIICFVIRKTLQEVS